MSSTDTLKEVIKALKDSVEPAELVKVVTNLQALQKKPEAPSKKEVQECIVNVVGMDAYEAAVLQVKNKMEKSKIDPTKQALNLDRYEELMQQAKARYASSAETEPVAVDPSTSEFGTTDAYEKAKQQALAYLDARAMQEAAENGQFTFSGANDFKLEVATSAASSGTGSKGLKTKTKAKGKSKSKPKPKGKAAASASTDAKPAKPSVSPVFSFTPSSEDDGAASGAAEKMGSLSLGKDNATAPFTFSAPGSASSFSFGAKAESE
jgi:hypothetical protein